MLIAYIDESERNSFYHIAAAVAEIRTWETIDTELDSFRHFIATTYNLPLNVEFHGHPLMGSEDGWEPMRAMHREIGQIYTKVLKTICQHDVKFFVQGVDVKRLNNRYRYPNHPHNVCMSHLLERLDDYALSHSADEVIVVADETGDEKRLIDQFGHSKIYGTGGYKNSKLTAISEPLNFASSAGSNGLQAVDMMLYVWQRDFHVEKEAHPRAQKLRDKLLAIVTPTIVSARTWYP